MNVPRNCRRTNRRDITFIVCTPTEREQKKKCENLCTRSAINPDPLTIVLGPALRVYTTGRENDKRTIGIQRRDNNRIGDILFGPMRIKREYIEPFPLINQMGYRPAAPVIPENIARVCTADSIYEWRAVRRNPRAAFIRVRPTRPNFSDASPPPPGPGPFVVRHTRSEKYKSQVRNDTAVCAARTGRLRMN